MQRKVLKPDPFSNQFDAKLWGEKVKNYVDGANSIPPEGWKLIMDPVATVHCGNRGQVTSHIGLSPPKLVFDLN
jgi:hypothetical protein